MWVNTMFILIFQRPKLRDLQADQNYKGSVRTSAVLLQSGLNESWWADSLECYTYLRNVTDLLSDGKTPHERRFGKPFEEHVIPFGSLVEYHPITARSVPNPSIGKESFTWIVPRIRSLRGGNLEG